MTARQIRKAAGRREVTARSPRAARSAAAGNSACHSCSGVATDEAVDRDSATGPDGCGLRCVMQGRTSRGPPGSRTTALTPLAYLTAGVQFFPATYSIGTFTCTSVVETIVLRSRHAACAAK